MNKKTIGFGKIGMNLGGLKIADKKDDDDKQVRNQKSVSPSSLFFYLFLNFSRVDSVLSAR